jgi:hypothetical protein
MNHNRTGFRGMRNNLKAINGHQGEPGSPGGEYGMQCHIVVAKSGKGFRSASQVSMPGEGLRPGLDLQTAIHCARAG